MLVRAAIVNHNTSLFSELALRSLVASHEADTGVELHVTVLDNHDFEEPATVSTMLEDLMADDSLWAVQARFRWPGAAMEAVGQTYGLSRAVAHHFFMASYDDEHVAARAADCRQRLARFADAWSRRPSGSLSEHTEAVGAQQDSV